MPRSEYHPAPERKSEAANRVGRNEASNGRTYNAPDGKVYHPSNSEVTNVHQSNSGKSTVIEHHDGIREVVNNTTGKSSYSRIPDSQRNTPPSVRQDPPAALNRVERNEASNGRTYTAPDGKVYHPNNSEVADVHQSNSGKSTVIDHKDGVREVVNNTTGKSSYARIPSNQVDHKYIAPPQATHRSYDQRPITNITVNENNYYLRENNYYRREPVFYDSYRWDPPAFVPVLFAAGATMLAMNAVWRNDSSRDSVSSMAGANYYSPQFEQSGISSDYDLLNATRTPDQRLALSDRTGIPYDQVRAAAGQADLMRINGIGPVNSRLLVDAGIDSVQDLARYTWDPTGLYNQLQYSSYYDGQHAPSLSQVESWIEQARTLPLALYDDDLSPNRPTPPPVEPPPVPGYVPPPRQSSW